MSTQELLDNFHEFASQQVRAVGIDLSIDELYSVWRSRHLIPAEMQDSVDAIEAAHHDFKSGDTGRPARAVLRDACRELGLVIDE